MNIKTIASLCLALLLVTGFSSEALAQKVLMRLDLAEGQTYSYVNTTDQVITQDIMGMNQVIDQTIQMYYDVTVSAVNEDGTYNLDYQYTRVVVDMDGGAMIGQTHFDSDEENEDIDPTAMGYAGLVGQGFSTVTSARGEILDLEGVDDMLDNMMSGFDELSDMEQETIRTSLKNQFGNEAMKNSLQNSSPAFPEEKMKIGDSWTSSSQSSAGFTINIESTTTLESVSGGTYTLNTEANQTSDPESSMEMNGMTMVYDMEGESHGTQIIDAETGMVKSYVVNQTMEGEVNASGGMMGAGMSWPMKIISITTVELME